MPDSPDSVAPDSDSPTSATEPAAPSEQAAPTRSEANGATLDDGLGITRKHLLGAGAIVALAFLGLVVFFGVDEATHRDRVSRNITLAGKTIDGADRSGLGPMVDDLAARYADSSIVLGDKSSTFSVPARGIALDVDRPATVQAAIDAGHSGVAPVRFVRWLKGFVAPTDARVVVTFDKSLLQDAIRKGDQGPKQQAVEPSFVIENDKLTAIGGTKGRGIDLDEAGDALEQAASSGLPMRITVERRSTTPKYALADAKKLAALVEDAGLRPLQVKAGSTTKTIDASTMRRWITTTPGQSALEIRVDEAKVGRDIEAQLADAGVDPVEPTWNVVDDKPSVTPGKDGTVCCDASAADVVANALTTRVANAQRNTPNNSAAPLELALKSAKPKTPETDIPKLGINQQIASFTTNYPAGQPRVENIHRISDIVRGQVIKPGETFSVNEFVGKRTVEKGFVVDHVIEDGKFAEAVGGGISQFATTFFNASFMGGLDFGEYQAHTIYISRYPYGREATVAFPHPDLQIRNTTPYGVLIWPTYTPTSITVTLYSTPYATGEQTNQTTAPRGACTRVTTERTRKYVDGRVAVDTVGATYQPEEGKKC